MVAITFEKPATRARASTMYVFDGTVGPTAVLPPDRVHAVFAKNGREPRVFRHRGLRNVDIGRIHHDRMLGDELMAVDHSRSFEIGEDPRASPWSVYRRVPRETHLHVEAQAVRVEDVVVEADPIKREVARGIVHPVNVARTLAVEPEIEERSTLFHVNTDASCDNPVSRTSLSKMEAEETTSSVAGSRAAWHPR